MRSLAAPQAVLLLLGALALLPGGSPASAAPPPPPEVIAVLGTAADGVGLSSAAAGARAAAREGSAPDGSAPSFAVEVFDDGGTTEGLHEALSRLRARKPVGVVAIPSGDLREEVWRAARSPRIPWFVVGAFGTDGVKNPGNVWHLGPSPAAEAVEAADAMLAPLAARSVAVLHEPTAMGHLLAATFVRSLSARVTLRGTQVWGAEDGPISAESLKGLEADWIYVALTGRYAEGFAKALAPGTWAPRCLFADGNRSPALLATAPAALVNSVFLDAPDSELQGRPGERLAETLEKEGRPMDPAAIRGYEAARRIVRAVARAGSTSAKKVLEAVNPETPEAGALGPLAFELHGGIRFFPLTFWRVVKGSLEPWPQGLLPTPGCGPPLGFGRVPPAPLNPKGKVGFLTFGEGDKRTIEADLLAIGLSTGGKDPEIDAFLRDEVLARAIRIAHRLFRREADGTPIEGWSWGMTFTTTLPGDDVPRSRQWLGIVAGDDPDAGGRVIGSGMAAIYSTFIQRTMYLSRKLDPPVSAEDKPLLDGTYLWGEDRSWNQRVDLIRCLTDGFASAVGLTLAHEFGHCCGCGHDTESPVSIMNVVAGAGASWEESVWIPSHQKNLTTTLGVEGVEK